MLFARHRHARYAADRPFEWFNLPQQDWLSMTRERVETLIIGGGQAGLAMSYMLSQRVSKLVDQAAGLLAVSP